MAHDQSRAQDPQSRVALHFPTGREFHWLSSDSPVMHWSKGDAVVFRNASWIVVDRAEYDGSLVLELGPSE